MTIKAIETTYRGYRFRSRLEARWAVFFDTLGVEWQYEPQGFLVSPAGGGPDRPYLPDFLLPTWGTWVEVKGDWSRAEPEYFNLLANAVDWGGALPGVGFSVGSSRGLLLLGPIPPRPVRYGELPTHTILQHDKGGWINSCVLLPPNGAGLVVAEHYGTYFDALNGDAGEDIVPAVTALRTISWPAGAGGERLLAAYDAARSARFEHGETPRV